uniref:probable pectinesterase 56 n=1 Tax=Fragaria vesca subsp. vesca TaxID=101020 RepID=UPI0005C8548F|nr:PREDICTED: probable pectinesterase 56 [Fragaria vesca subsp. vesca]
MDAVDVVPENSHNCVIRIKTGVYDEIVTVGKKKCNVVFIGDCVKTTVVIGNRSNIKGVRTFESATLVIEGDGFLATGITFVNMVEPEAGQAVAVRISSYHTAFYRCRIADFQDTLYTQDGVQFFKECEIYDTIDFWAC